MKVVMLTMECGPKGTWRPGDVRNVSEEHGKELIKGKYAKRYEEEEKQPVMETATEAAAEEREQAVATPKKKRATKKASTKKE